MHERRGPTGAELAAALAGEQGSALVVGAHVLRHHAQQLGEDASGRPHVDRRGVCGRRSQVYE